MRWDKIWKIDIIQETRIDATSYELSNLPDFYQKWTGW